MSVQQLLSSGFWDKWCAVACFFSGLCFFLSSCRGYKFCTLGFTDRPAFPTTAEGQRSGGVTLKQEISAAWNMDAAVHMCFMNACLSSYASKQSGCSVEWDFLGETQRHQAACNLQDSVKE